MSEEHKNHRDDQITPAGRESDRLTRRRGAHLAQAHELSDGEVPLRPVMPAVVGAAKPPSFEEKLAAYTTEIKARAQEAVKAENQAVEKLVTSALDARAVEEAIDLKNNWKIENILASDGNPRKVMFKFTRERIIPYDEGALRAELAVMREEAVKDMTALGLHPTAVEIQMEAGAKANSEARNLYHPEEWRERGFSNIVYSRKSEDGEHFIIDQTVMVNIPEEKLAHKLGITHKLRSAKGTALGEINKKMFGDYELPRGGR